MVLDYPRGQCDHGVFSGGSGEMKMVRESCDYGRTSERYTTAGFEDRERNCGLKTMVASRHYKKQGN